MNKVTKGTLAAAAAGALLLGGAGTFATWSDEGAIAADSISTGHLVLEDVVSSEWTYLDDSEYAKAIVPGDTLKSTHKVTVDAVGDNIDGTLTLTGLDGFSQEEVEVTIVAENVDGVTESDDQNGVFTFEEAGTHTLNVLVTVNFPAASSATMDKTINLNAIDLALQQGVVKPVVE